MPGFIDLHCHWLPGVDDGSRSLQESAHLLAELGALGFATVVATPHMRPGMYDNQRDQLVARFREARTALGDRPDLPALELGAEHYFDEVVFARLLAGEGLPLSGGTAVLLEFHELALPASVDRRLAELRRHRLLPVIAHPERCRALWQNAELLERLLDVGAAALLDAAALTGRYGRLACRWAEEFLERGLYHAACSDAHRPEDVRSVAAAMQLIAARHGADELTFLFCEGPTAILSGRIPG